MRITDAHMAGSPFGSKYQPTKQVAPLIPSNSKFNDLHKVYEKMLDLSIYITYPQDKIHELYFYVKSNVKDILTVPDIQRFLQTTQAYENAPGYAVTTGIFISHLVQQAHNHGEDTFTLSTVGLKEISYVCYNLVKKEDRRLQITIKGHVGYNSMSCANGGTYYLESANRAFQCAENITAYIDQASDWTATSSHNSTIFIRTGGDYIGRHSQNSTFYLDTVKDDFCKNSNNVTAIAKYTGRDCLDESRDCTAYAYQFGEFRDVQLASNTFMSPNDVLYGSVERMSFTQWNDIWKQAEEGFARLDDVLRGGR